MSHIARRSRSGTSLRIRAALAALLMSAVPLSGPTVAQGADTPFRPIPAGRYDTSDEALVARLPGFANRFATVNGVRLHYVVGGAGEPLILLPGHPETWWAYRRIMPTLARSYRVIVVDIRGMGTSDKPQGGYDKKTMAEDIYQLTRQLGFKSVNLAGHDIGAMVAFAMAANHPDSVRRLALLDVPHPDESWYDFPMLPREGQLVDKVDATHPPYAWWFAFHQVQGLPEKLLAGNGMREYLAWNFNYLFENNSKLDPLSFAVYGDRYSTPEAIRAGHAWYRAWPRDIEDQKAYPKLTMPVLGLGGEYTGWTWLQIERKHATDFRLVKVERSGHFIFEEQPDFVAAQLLAFFQKR